MRRIDDPTASHVQANQFSVATDFIFREHHVLDVWQGCQQYYYRCISRKAQFTASLASPSKVSQGKSCDRCMAGLSAVLLQMYIKKGSVYCLLSLPF